MSFATFSNYDVESKAGTPSTAEVTITLGEGDTAVGALLFYAPAHLPTVIAQITGDVYILRYPTTRFHEVYQLLRDGARTIVAFPDSNSGFLQGPLSGASASDMQKRWDEVERLVETDVTT